MRRLHRYVLQEMLLPFFLALGLISFLLLMKKILDLVDLVLKQGVPFYTVAELIVYVLPATFAITVPMSLLVAVLLALGRLASDLELVAMRAGGISLARLYPPLLAAGLVLSGGMLAFNEGVLPLANESYRALFYDVIRQRSDVALQEQAWISDFQGLMLYIDAKDKASKELRGITLIRPETPGKPLQWIRAKRGRLISDKTGFKVFLDLYDGTVQVMGGPRHEDMTEMGFDYSRLDLDIGGALAQLQSKDRQPQEMSMREITQAVAAMPQGDPRIPHYLTEMHKKAAIPFACLFFMLCGLPLGTLTRRGGRILGFVMAIGLIFAYYVCLSLGQTFGDDARLPAWAAMWLPNLVMAALAAAAGWSAFKERGIFAFTRS